MCYDSLTWELNHLLCCKTVYQTYSLLQSTPGKVFEYLGAKTCRIPALSRVDKETPWSMIPMLLVGGMTPMEDHDATLVYHMDTLARQMVDAPKYPSFQGTYLLREHIIYVLISVYHKLSVDILYPMRQNGEGLLPKRHCHNAAARPCLHCPTSETLKHGCR